MDDIHRWWKDLPEERFWLGVVGRDEGGVVLAEPCGSGRHPSAKHALITHVMEGDTVFHYDTAERAIVAASSARGRVRRRPLIWSRHEQGEARDHTTPRLLPSWVIELEPPVPLDPIVSLGHIARVQWDLFPELRAFEDQVGEPLYYPFEMGSASESSLLGGHVFKLPRLFVERFPELNDMAERMASPVTIGARAGNRRTETQRAEGGKIRAGTMAPTR